MGLRECLNSAIEQGAITRKEAAALGDDFENRYAQSRLSMSDDMAKSKARKDMEIQLAAQAREKRRTAALTEARRVGVAKFLQNYRNRAGKPDIFEGAMGLLSHYGYRGVSSVRGRTEGIINSAHLKLSDVMFTFQRKGVLGQRQNRALTLDLTRELHGEASGDATAKALAEAVSAVFEDLRQRFNAAGGAIGKIANYGLPHSHDRMKIMGLAKGDPVQQRALWKETIKPLLDPDRMVNPLTGQPVGADGLDKALDHVFDSIISENRANLTPTMQRQGRGSISGQRQDERFLVFKNAEAWTAYNDQFGKGDPIQAIFQHIRGMSGDIAAMEILGPNPAAMVEYIKQHVQRQVGNREAGKASLSRERRLIKASQADYEGYRLDALWSELRGKGTVVQGWGKATGSLKNFLVSAQLGSTAILALVTDPFIAAASRKLAGLPLTKDAGAMLKMLSSANREEIIRSGVIWDEYIHVMNDELRWAGPAVGAEWTRWLADRAVTFGGLKPLTTGRKLVEARVWQGFLADNAGKKFAELDAPLRNTLEGFGVGNDTWEIWRNSVDTLGFVTPAEIAERGGAVQYLDMSAGALSSPAHAAEAKALRHRAAAEQLSEVITSWSERSVPSGTPNARSVLTGKVERGTFAGEFIDMLLQYKSFGLSLTAMQLEAAGEMGAARRGGKGIRTGAAYLAGLVVPLSVGGTVYVQLKNMIDGKEAESWDSPGLYVKGIFAGGGFGLFGDFTKATENRFGQSVLEALAGPGTAFIGDTLQMSIGNIIGLAGREKLNPGRDLTQYIRRYTPLIASHWATRGAFNRLVLDNLQWHLDPRADKSFKAQARNAKKIGAPYRQGFEPGAFTP